MGKSEYPMRDPRTIPQKYLALSAIVVDYTKVN
jgi:hypothetical protein